MGKNLTRTPYLRSVLLVNCMCVEWYVACPTQSIPYYVVGLSHIKIPTELDSHLDIVCMYIHIRSKLAVRGWKFLLKNFVLTFVCEYMHVSYGVFHTMQELGVDINFQASSSFATYIRTYIHLQDTCIWWGQDLHVWIVGLFAFWYNYIHVLLFSHVVGWTMCDVDKIGPYACNSRYSAVVEVNTPPLCIHNCTRIS